MYNKKREIEPHSRPCFWKEARMKRTILTAGTYLFLATAAAAQVGPPPPSPPVAASSTSSPTAAGSGSIGPVVVSVAVAYTARGILGTQVIAHAQRRQATLLEFLLWPLPTRAPSPTERRRLELMLAYDNLPSRLRQHMHDVVGDRKAWTYPSTRAMMAALRRAGVRWSR